MGFISFNENYYSKKLEMFENKKLNEADLYEIRQLLKVLDDLSDEGYTNLNNQMETDFLCLSRLRNLLKKEGAIPFANTHNDHKSIAYGSEELELSNLLERLMYEARNLNQSVLNPFLKSVHEYCEWIGYEEDTAYVFLLRDAMLPYVYFKTQHNEHAYPWLISRRFLENITKTEFVDDAIRLPIYESLENGYTDFETYCFFCRERILDVLNQYPGLKKILLELLGSIKEKKVVVIESGYMGTIPMMLKALDDRVMFKLYTTAPFLYKTYQNNIFCRKYEDVRKFETLYSQNLLMQYASFHDGKFYVNISEDESVKGLSLAEIREFMDC